MNYFDDDTRLVFHYAREEAQQLRQSQVGPVHLLLGLLRGQGQAREGLEQAGIRLADLRGQLAQNSSASPQGSLHDAPSITPAARLAMERAAKIAQQMHAAVTSTPHMLLALLDDAEVRELLSDKADLELLRQQVQETAEPDPEREVWEGKTVPQLVSETQGWSGLPPEGLSRESLLIFALMDGSDPVLRELESLLFDWLTLPALDEVEKKALLRAVVTWGARDRR